jgi:hypothetical protein
MELTINQINGLTNHYNDKEFYSDISIDSRIELIIKFCVERFNTNYVNAKKIVNNSDIKSLLK